jgi:hypothetical protein
MGANGGEAGRSALRAEQGHAARAMNPEDTFDEVMLFAPEYSSTEQERDLAALKQLLSTADPRQTRNESTVMLDDKSWSMLIQRIADRRCTPFLGAGSSHPALPLGAEIARKWAAEYHYPLENTSSLSEVAQFLAVEFDPLFPKSEMLKLVAAAEPPSFSDADEPHGVLADLPFSVYLTTNYDGFMVEALKSPPRYKDPKRELCRWNEALEGEPSHFESGYEPTVANPVVFHLHGHAIPESIVLTEDDYLTFLAAIARNAQLLPGSIQKALDRSTCLFIGYRLADWNFRVLFQGLRARLRYMNIAVLKPPPDSAQAAKQQAYLEQYYASMDLRVYWGTAREFAAELRQRWEQR